MSKELFFNMRAEDLALMYSEDFTKKKAIEQGEKLVNTIFENGEIEFIKVFSNIVRLKEVINAADKKFRERAEFISKESFNGVEFNPSNPKKSLNYEEDIVYYQIKKQLQKRKEDLDRAHNSNTIEFDNEGCELPKVGVSYTKPSITITF